MKKIHSFFVILFIFNSTLSMAQSVVTNRNGKEISVGSNFYLSGGTTDAGTDKTSTIYRTGNLGIGVTTPTVPLEIQSSSVSSYVTTAKFLTPSNTTAGNSNVLNFGITSTTGNSADWRYVYQGSGSASNRVDFGMSGYTSPMMSYLNSGNVGIGITAPLSKLHIQGPQATLIGANVQSNMLRLSRPTWSGFKWGSAAQFNLGTYDDGLNPQSAKSRLDLALTNGADETTFTNVMTWLGSGSVGINTTAPSAPLVVQGVTGTGALKLIAPSVASGDNWWLGFGHGTTSTDANDRARIGVDILGGGSGRLFFTTGPTGTQTRAMFINESQKVGIGTNSPLQRLHVVGQVEIDTLLSGASTDSLLTANSSGVIRRLSFSNAMKNFPVVSASVLGIVNNTSGQELGGVDKKINGVDMGRGGGSISSSTRVGNGALISNTTGTNNAAFGYQASYSNTTGSYNSSFGFQSLYTNAVSSANTAFGTQAMFSTNNGNYNVGVGAFSLQNQTSGSSNTAVGYNAGNAITTSLQNVAIGAEALSANVTSGNNVAVGAYSLDLTTGGNNTGLGFNAGKFSTTGTGNTFVGYKAGETVTTGSNNILLGANAGTYITTGGGNISIGNSNLISGSNNTIIGGTTTSANIGANYRSNVIALANGVGNVRVFADSLGLVGINTISPQTTLHVNNNTASTATVNVDGNVLRLSRPGTSNVKWDNIAQFNLGSYSTNLNANTRLDLALTDGASTTTSNVMTWQGNGNVGINTVAPTEKLQVFGGNVIIGGIGTGSVASPMLRMHSNANTNASGGLIEFNESDLAYGYAIRHNTNAGAYGNDGLWFEKKNASVYTPVLGYDDSNNVGIGTTTPKSKLEVNGTVGALLRTSSVSTTTANDFTLLMTTASTTVTLEAPTTVTRRIMVIKNTSTGTVSVTGHIDGTASSTIVLLTKESIEIQSDGTTWQIIAQYSTPTPLAVSAQLYPVSINSGTNTALTSYANISDTSNGAWNATTGTFTCNIAGLYRFEFRAMFALNNWTQGNEINAYFTKNGTNVQSASWFAASTYNQYAFSGHNFATFNLVVGDQIKVNIWHNAGAARTTYNKEFSIFSIYKIN